MQRQEQAEARDAHLNDRLDGTLKRVEALERTTVSREQLNARTARVYVVLGLAIAVLGPVVSLLVAWLGTH